MNETFSEWDWEYTRLSVSRKRNFSETNQRNTKVACSLDHRARSSTEQTLGMGGGGRLTSVTRNMSLCSTPWFFAMLTSFLGRPSPQGRKELLEALRWLSLDDCSQASTTHMPTQGLIIVNYGWLDEHSWPSLEEDIRVSPTQKAWSQVRNRFLKEGRKERRKEWVEGRKDRRKLAFPRRRGKRNNAQTEPTDRYLVYRGKKRISYSETHSVYI